MGPIPALLKAAGTVAKTAATAANTVGSAAKTAAMNTKTAQAGQMLKTNAAKTLPQMAAELKPVKESKNLFNSITEMDGEQLGKILGEKTGNNELPITQSQPAETSYNPGQGQRQEDETIQSIEPTRLKTFSQYLEESFRV